MPNFNRVILAGHLTCDPQVKQLLSGPALAEFGLAVRRSWKAKNGEKQNRTSFFDCQAFGQRGETIAAYLTKGQAVLIEGELRQDRWEAKDGTKRSRVMIHVTGFTFLGRKSEGEQEESPPVTDEPAQNGPGLPF